MKRNYSAPRTGVVRAEMMSGLMQESVVQQQYPFVGNSTEDVPTMPTDAKPKMW